MKTLGLSMKLAAIVFTALLCACAAPSNVGMPDYAQDDKRQAQDDRVIFKYTGAEQQFSVPAGVTQVSITVDGASGSGGYGNGASGGSYASLGGLGGRVTATISVTPGESLAIYVGGSGEHRGFNLDKRGRSHVAEVGDDDPSSVVVYGAAPF